MKKNYMAEFEVWLHRRFEELLDLNKIDEFYGYDDFKEALKDKILESYRNGQRSPRVREPASSPSPELQ